MFVVNAKKKEAKISLSIVLDKVLNLEVMCIIWMLKLISLCAFLMKQLFVLIESYIERRDREEIKRDREEMKRDREEMRRRDRDVKKIESVCMNE